MSSTITLLFQARKTFVFIPQSVITFSIFLPPFLSLLQSLLFFSEFLHCGFSLSYTDKLIFSPSLFIFSYSLLFHLLYPCSLRLKCGEPDSDSLQRNQIVPPTSDGLLPVPEIAFFFFWSFLRYTICSSTKWDQSFGSFQKVRFATSG